MVVVYWTGVLQVLRYPLCITRGFADHVASFSLSILKNSETSRFYNNPAKPGRSLYLCSKKNFCHWFHVSTWNYSSSLAASFIKLRSKMLVHIFGLFLLGNLKIVFHPFGQRVSRVSITRFESRSRSYPYKGWRPNKVQIAQLSDKWILPTVP